MTITISGTTGIAGVNGSVATPSVQGADTNTGMFFPAADTVGIATGGTEAMRINSSGNVGIGTSIPSQKLHVAGSGSTYTRVSSSNASTGAGAYYVNATATWVIGAGPTSGGSEFAFVDQTSGSLERMRLDASGNLLFNSGYGSVATAYGCRAWVNFNGTGTVAIRNSGNVTSITDNSAGNYTVNFTTAMPDINYSISAMGGSGNTAGNYFISNYGGAGVTTTTVRIVSWVSHTAAQADADTVTVSIFR